MAYLLNELHSKILNYLTLILLLTQNDDIILKSLLIQNPRIINLAPNVLLFSIVTFLYFNVSCK